MARNNFEGDYQKVLGIEGGATRTEWIHLENKIGQWTLIDQGYLPAANFRLLSSETDLIRLFDRLPKDATHIGVYLPGVMDSNDKFRLSSLIQKTWPLAVVSTGNDRESGLETAFNNKSGILIISGTGSCITGRNGDQIINAGGRGHILGDKGSAYNVAINCLQFAMERLDKNGSPCALLVRILQDLCLNQVSELVFWVQNADKGCVAALATVVFEAYRQGDLELLGILKEGVQHLARTAAAVSARLGKKNMPVALAGSMFCKEQLYAELMKEALKELLPESDVSVCTLSGALGAARLAVTENNITINKRTVKGIRDLQGRLLEMDVADTEQRNERSLMLEHMTNLEIVDMFIEEEKFVYEALKKCNESLSAAVSVVFDALKRGGHLVYVGAGTSGRLGVLDASEIPPTFGEPHTTVQGIIAGGVKALYRCQEGAEDDPSLGALAVRDRGLTNKDVVCGITACGRTPFVLGALDEAKQLGATTLLITNNPNRKIKSRYHLEIVLATGPELITGSSRLKAGTATKVALNIITTGAMVRLGRVKSNLMVNVKATNDKLKYRATKLLSNIGKYTYEEAYEILQKNEWDLANVISGLKL